MLKTPLQAGILSPSASTISSSPSTGSVNMSFINFISSFSSANVFIYCFVGKQFKQTLKIFCKGLIPRKAMKVEAEAENNEILPDGKEERQEVIEIEI